MGAEEEVGRAVGDGDRDEGGDPDEVRERLLEVEVLLVAVEGAREPPLTK
jgi:hypothetical protein